MHIHILGICGTFMGGLAVLAKQLGYRVTGSDANVYPPMSEQLSALGIELMQGYSADNLKDTPDIVVIGNALSRGNPEVEAVLEQNLYYLSGPQWLHEHVLKDKWVIAVSGTHGKTTTTSMLAWILEANGCKPGFLIGGVANNFGISARLGDSIFFVIEADEYDSAFFDKRSKFVHYYPRTLIINNLEFDHADIFDNLAAIQKQFHHLIRTIPGSGLILKPESAAIDEVFEKGCWSETEKLAANHDWDFKAVNSDFSEFELFKQGESAGVVKWNLLGEHNAHNATMAIAAAYHVGVRPEYSIESLMRFENVKRRLELKGCVNQIKVYDDFAHHPTAIKTTLSGLKNHMESGRIIAVLEPRSNTMKMGIHKHELAESLKLADKVFMLQPESISWALADIMQASDINACIYNALPELVDQIVKSAQTGDSILVMSNGGFGGIHQKLLDSLAKKVN
ncbi:UDP-N-acetylmuramate:L-alanyl-gamma-D-glutamyl-meso-diaminopimelate ligase [Catenovulum adriaticum]|uniref:UDP-N-acetylmuramate--L-alanyl-gamma-D-glutamyl-meso-2,6-diaminoheptandioate ligase n=1 Tax=Catenovulum adriaticum TaxID=2984846 RepID=A0ABY7AS38_9ALTE|nr:UDP-N-acetylmuramate:L-alanyl-gamma-D-glutamyl-meso-diaminopimelate ligase [Catenovulum sp. TS8]WAJ71081.1 UDP-N-acetylmuramate:L-alanyl-gamma-D-glutamyl-meso-diaminopimelate ligase [Catenovulum sp. TS8]